MRQRYRERDLLNFPFLRCGKQSYAYQNYEHSEVPYFLFSACTHNMKLVKALCRKKKKKYSVIFFFSRWKFKLDVYKITQCMQKLFIHFKIFFHKISSMNFTAKINVQRCCSKGNILTGYLNFRVIIHISHFEKIIIWVGLKLRKWDSIYLPF